MCLYQITGKLTGRDACVTDVRYDSGNRLVAIGVKNCNRRHEKLKVIYVDKERVKRVFRIVQAHDDKIFTAKFSPQSSDSIPLLPHKSCEFMNVLEGTDLGIFSVSKAENQAVQTELVCFVERIQQEAVQFFQGRVLYHKGALRNIGLIISVHFHRIEDGFVLHGPKSKHVYTSNRMIIASAHHLAYEGTLVKPVFFAAEGRCLSGANGSVSKSANDAPKAVDVNAKINMTKFMRARYLFGIKTWNRNEEYAVNW